MEFEILLRSHGEERARQLLAERYSLQGSQKPFLVLHDVKSASAARSKRHKRKSTANRQLASFVASGDPSYSAYLPLNALWNDYMRTVLAGAGGAAQAAAQAVLSADWHGALVRVVASRNPTFVGLEGLLLWESRNQLLLVTKSDRFKRVPKHGTVFILVLNDTSNSRDMDTKEAHGARGVPQVLEMPAVREFTVIGDRVQCRSTERTTRKFKPHDVADVAPLSRAFW